MGINCISFTFCIQDVAQKIHKCEVNSNIDFGLVVKLLGSVKCFPWVINRMV
jgi:hypothetical protein